MRAFSQSLEVAQGLCTGIRNELQKLDSTSASERQRQDTKIEGMLNDLQQKIGGLRGQMNSLSPDDKEMYAEDLKDLEKERSDMNTELRQKRASFEKNSKVQTAHDANMDKGQAIINNMDTALKTGQDTLNTMDNIKGTLAEDQKHFDHIEENLNQVEIEGEKGEVTAKRMYRRMVIQRVIQWSIVVVLFAFFIFSCYWKFRPQ